MFEKRIEKLSEEIGEEEKRNFYILTHKKHRREIYFQNNQKAISFIGSKFNTPLKEFRRIKKFAYFLIKLRLLQPFLKKINLSSKFGDVIFVGGQIKGFNLKTRRVISFPLEQNQFKDFLESKKFQAKIAKKRFAPEIFEINKKVPYSVEELLKEHPMEKDMEIFKKLYSFYKKNNIKSVPVKEYAQSLLKKIDKRKIKNNFLNKVLKKHIKSNKQLFITKVHGDFAREQVLIKNGEIVFVDWNPMEDLITFDLINFFRGEKNLLWNKKFLKLLKEIFPIKVQKNIKEYIILNEISKIVMLGEINDISLERIKRYCS